MSKKWWPIFNIDESIARIISNAEEQVWEQHNKISTNALFNQSKVLEAFQAENITEECFLSNEGYGYNDHGREKLEALFSRVFKGEEAIVRPHFVSGTHTLFACLKGILRPGDRMVSLTGQPYDTLSRAIWGNKKDTNNLSSLFGWGIDVVSYKNDLEKDAAKCVQLESVLENPTKVVFIQRSRGYSPERNSLTVGEIGRLVNIIKKYNSKLTIFVDNCYGEFVETLEPLEVGVDLIAGSLIKNPGGGLAPTGGYVVGKRSLVKQVSEAMTAPGLGKELGAFVSGKRLYYQGLFMAPHVVGEALKGAVTIAAALQLMGYRVEPGPADKRGDIVQSVYLKGRDELHAFCRAVQHFSPVNSHVTPEAGKTAGYADPIFMAAGTFVQGASSEFTADAPLRRPYVLYLQGGLTYEHTILGLASILNTIK